MLTARLKTILLALIVASPLSVTGTSVAVFVTPYGIVASTDRKQIYDSGDVSAYGDEETKKYYIVQGRIVVLSTGTSVAGYFHYSFLEWMKTLSFPPDASVDESTDVIEKESTKSFAETNVAILSKEIRQHSPDEFCQTWVRYIIAGYQNGTPHLYEVVFYIDWNSQTLVGPKRIILEPSTHPIGDVHHFFVHSYMFGVKDAMGEFLNKKSYAYRRTMQICPTAFGDLMSKRDFTLDETICVSRALIRIEEETNPDFVGGKVQTVKISTCGFAEDLSDETSRSDHIAKSKSVDQKQK